MVTIVCLKWGDKYGPEYVDRLYAGVRRHTTLPFRFICFTDDPTGITAPIQIRQLKEQPNLWGWWYKVTLFDPSLGLSGRLIFMDLDTVIIGNIDQILAYRGSFAILDDFINQGVGFGSAIMAWEGGTLGHIWHHFAPQAEAMIGQIAGVHGQGDQLWIQMAQPKADLWQQLYPSQIVSYKNHCRTGPPADSRIICFWGEPRPHQAAAKLPWVAAAWNPPVLHPE
jgi:hypothetical protein